MTTVYDLKDASDIASPALLYYVDAIRDNIALTVKIAGGPDRLWPHVKTHKLAEVLRMQAEAGIRRFKCATIAEAEMLAAERVPEVLLAYPPVGPNVRRFVGLMKAFPGTAWWTIADSAAALAHLDAEAGAAGLCPGVLVDVNMGMDRTGVAIDGLKEFYGKQASLTNIRLRGLHCYDGHIRDSDPAERQVHADAAADAVLSVRDALLAEGLACDTVVMGGSPTFPCHVGRAGVYLSPGTVFINDYGYGSAFADLPFAPAAAILTRVISLPARGLFTLDLGHKAIGADPAGARGVIASLPGAVPISQSEEHWVFRMDADDPSFPGVGDVLYVVPTHICPTTALYSEVLAVREGRVIDAWRVAARDRRISL